MEALKAELTAAGQEHLLEGWEELSSEEQQALKEQLEVRVSCQEKLEPGHTATAQLGCIVPPLACQPGCLRTHTCGCAHLQLVVSYRPLTTSI